MLKYWSKTTKGINIMKMNNFLNAYITYYYGEAELLLNKNLYKANSYFDEARELASLSSSKILFNLTEKQICNLIHYGDKAFLKKDIKTAVDSYLFAKNCIDDAKEKSKNNFGIKDLNFKQEKAVITKLTSVCSKFLNHSNEKTM